MKTEIQVLKEKIDHYSASARYWRDKYLQLEKEHKKLTNLSLKK